MSRYYPGEYPWPAPAGTVWVCGACGKQSRDKAGVSKISAGWDESCFLNAVLCEIGGPPWRAAPIPEGEE